MLEQRIPFLFTSISNNTPQPIKDGQIISTLNKCGLFLCRRGEIKISLEGKPYLIKRGDMYIYIPSTLVRPLYKSPDAEGFLIEVDLDYVIPITNRVMNVENILFIRKYPCVSLSEKQFIHLDKLLESLQMRISLEEAAEVSIQRQNLITELIKSMGQTICYEILNIYFTNQPLHPLLQDKKDLIFQNFMLSLYRFYRRERDVTFYAKLQHITPRYFSSIIKEKSGSNASQWIIQMVISEAKQLLERSDLSIKEIAAELNFSNQSFFGKYFKQYVGISPKEYRQSGLKQKQITIF